MKKIILIFSLLLCWTIGFSQSMFLDAGNKVPTDAPQGQPVISYSFNGPNELSVTLVMGAMSQDLIMAVVSGTGFSKMELTAYDSENKVVSKITMQDVLLISYQTSGGLNETVTMTYSKIKIKN